MVELTDKERIAVLEDKVETLTLKLNRYVCDQYEIISGILKVIRELFEIVKELK
jgi:hypothetical protein